MPVMGVLERIHQRAKGNPQLVVFPEGEDARIIQAVDMLQQETFVRPLLLGSPRRIRTAAEACGVKVNCEIVEPVNSPWLEGLAERYYERSRFKGMTREEARQKAVEPLYFGALMVADGRCGGCVAGATHSTAETVRAGLRCIGLAPGSSLLSSCFIMLFDNPNLGVEGALLYADCAVVPSPTVSQLADIAGATAHNTRLYLEIEPRVAFLSFSTHGSAQHPTVTRVREATQTFRARNPEILADGELQLDAAVVEQVAVSKATKNLLKGKSNTLIFPNLDAGNIAYKLSQRLAGARAIGPILQGIERPMNDLSRGCTIQDVVDLGAVTGLQAARLQENYVRH